MPAEDQVNLLPKDEFESSPVGKFIKWAVGIGRWIVVLTEFVVICAFLSRFYFDTKLANLFDDIKQKQAIVDSALPFEERFRLVQERIKIVKALLAEEKHPSDLFVEVTGLLPFDIFLTGMGTEEEKLVLKGYFLSDKSLKVFLSGLMSSPHLEEVILENVATQKDNPSAVNFSISAMIKK